MPKIVELNSRNFDRVLRSSRKLFVDFWAPSCKPCIRMNPLIERVAERHQDAVTFAKVNVEQDGEIATRYHVSSIPAYFVFTNATPSISKIGAITETELEKLIVENC